MARRGASHSFNKRQKERKRKEKAERKVERRLLRKQPVAGEAELATEQRSEASVVDGVLEGHELVEGVVHRDVDVEAVDIVEAVSRPENVASARD